MRTDNSYKILRTLAAVTVITVAPAACDWFDDDDDGGGGGAGSGVFLDDAVEGLSFSSGSHTGETDADGTFSYGDVEDEITFTVGDIEIGTGNAKPVMTPVDLVNDEDPTAVDETNDRVTNIARFLQTIDDDGDPSNDILITQDVRDAAGGMAVEFDQTIAAFESDTNVLDAVAALTTVTSAGARGLVPVDAAQEQLRETLVAQFAGCYEGTFQGTIVPSGSVSGTFTITTDDSGEITGTFTDESGMVSPVTIPLVGEIASSGAFTLTGTAGTATVTLEGNVADGVVDGQWLVTNADVTVASGTLSGAACSGTSFSYVISTTVSSNPDSHPNHFEGALCTIEVAENDTDATVECTKEGVLDVLASGTISGTSFTATGTGTYAGITTAFMASGTFDPATDTFSGSMSAGTDGALPDTNANSVHEPIEVDFTGLL